MWWRLTLFQISGKLTQLTTIKADSLVTWQEELFLLVGNRAHTFDRLNISGASLTFFVGAVENLALFNLLHTNIVPDAVVPALTRLKRQWEDI